MPGTTEGPEKRRLAASLLEHPSEADIAELIEVDKEIFPTMPIDDEVIRGALESSGVQVILRGEDGKIAGYIISRPHNEVYDELKKLDPELEVVEGGLYAESMGIVPKARGALSNLRAMGDTFVAEAKRKGFVKITGHFRVSEGLSGVLQNRANAQKLRTIENWLQSGEPFDYLEIGVD